MIARGRHLDQVADAVIEALPIIRITPIFETSLCVTPACK